MDSFITRDIGSNFRGVPLFIFTIFILQYVAYTLGFIYFKRTFQDSYFDDKKIKQT